jgi:hypothetical protein
VQDEGGRSLASAVTGQPTVADGYPERRLVRLFKPHRRFEKAIRGNPTYLNSRINVVKTRE